MAYLASGPIAYVIGWRKKRLDPPAES
jgi:hypothetical protein